ncbi:MAG: hypothetical protein JW776_08910 [Candidatus Lokiarchaeota archaeon]|nr:hypothetical protein [Candidatus Lokiarchaeota archaeon]
MSWKDKFRAAEEAREEGEKEQYEGTLYAHYKNMKWWQTIGDGFKLLAKTYLPTLLIFVSLAIVFSLISTFIMTEYNWKLTEEGFQLQVYIDLYGDSQEAFENVWPQEAKDFYSLYRRKISINNVVNLFVNYFSLVIGGILITSYILEIAKGKKVTIFETIKHTFRGERITVTLLSTLVLTILTAAGFAFYFIFGIVMLIMIGLCVPVLVDTNLSFRDVLNDGFKLGKEYRIRTIILIIVAVLFFSFFGNFLANLFFLDWTTEDKIGWLDPATRNWGMLIYVNMMNFITTALFQPILFTFLVSHYLELTVQKEVEWFDFSPLAKKKMIPLKDYLKPKDVLMNIVPLTIFIILSIVMTIDFYFIS